MQAAAAKGEAPPGLPLKGAGQEDSSDAQPRVNACLTDLSFPGHVLNVEQSIQFFFCDVHQANGGMLKEGDALSGELWEEKRERIRKASIYGKLPGWDLRSVSAA